MIVSYMSFVPNEESIYLPTRGGKCMQPFGKILFSFFKTPFFFLFYHYPLSDILAVCSSLGQISHVSLELAIMVKKI